MLKRALTPEMPYVLEYLLRLAQIIDSQHKFYNLAIFMSSVAVFSLVAQRMASGKTVVS